MSEWIIEQELPPMDITEQDERQAKYWCEDNLVAGTYYAAMLCRERQLLSAFHAIKTLTSDASNLLAPPAPQGSGEQ